MSFQMKSDTFKPEQWIPFFTIYLPQVTQSYNWPVGNKAKQGLPTFGWREESGSLDECIALKQHLSQAWADADDAKRTELARWVVSDWGGVRANRIETLQNHLALVLNDDSEKPLKGVASYSKILTAKDCTQYAIYDARVAACLNAAQLITNVERPVFFHYVPSRNNVIQRFMNMFSKQELVGKRSWVEIDSDATYSTYMSLLHNLKVHFQPKDIYHFEMTLFSLAPSICADLVSTPH
jgi:hypothetical protein